MTVCILSQLSLSLDNLILIRKNKDWFFFIKFVNIKNIFKLGVFWHKLTLTVEQGLITDLIWSCSSKLYSVTQFFHQQLPMEAETQNDFILKFFCVRPHIDKIPAVRFRSYSDLQQFRIQFSINFYDIVWTLMFPKPTNYYLYQRSSVECLTSQSMIRIFNRYH